MWASNWSSDANEETRRIEDEHYPGDDIGDDMGRRGKLPRKRGGAEQYRAMPVLAKPRLITQKQS